MPLLAIDVSSLWNDSLSWQETPFPAHCNYGKPLFQPHAYCQWPQAAVAYVWQLNLWNHLERWSISFLLVFGNTSCDGLRSGLRCCSGGGRKYSWGGLKQGGMQRFHVSAPIVYCNEFTRWFSVTVLGAFRFTSIRLRQIINFYTASLTRKERCNRYLWSNYSTNRVQVIQSYVRLTLFDSQLKMHGISGTDAQSGNRHTQL